MSSFFENKMRTLFKRFDVDGNGVIEEADFEYWSDRLISLGNLDTDKSFSLKSNIKQLWTFHFAPADKNRDGTVSFEEFLTFTRDVNFKLDFYLKNFSIKFFKLQSLSDQNKQETLKAVLPLIFDSVDVDKSGSISFEEFSNFYKSINIDNQDETKNAFTTMDADNDNSISKEGRNEISTINSNYQIIKLFLF